jgi:hypothetical protein
MIAWLIINFIWSAILIIASARLYWLARQIEGDRQKLSQWNEKQQRKQTQL